MIFCFIHYICANILKKYKSHLKIDSFYLIVLLSCKYPLIELYANSIILLFCKLRLDLNVKNSFKIASDRYT